MPRRLISSDTLTHPVLTSQPISARYLWDALIKLTDDSGRVCVDPVYLLRVVFVGSAKGVSKELVGSWIDQWEEYEMLLTYPLGKLKYAKLTNFEKHNPGLKRQKMSRREQKRREENTHNGNGASCDIDSRWKHAEDLVRKARPSIKSPGAYIASLREKYNYGDPSEALGDLWIEPEAVAEQDERREIIEGLQEAGGSSVCDAGLKNDQGIMPWLAFNTERLRGILERLRETGEISL